MSIEQVPENKDFYLKIALDKQKEGDFLSTLKYLNLARDADPSDADILAEIAETYYLLGAYTSSATAYARVFNMTKNSIYLLGAMSAYWYELESDGRPKFNDGLGCDRATEELLDTTLKYDKVLRVISDRTQMIADALEDGEIGAGLHIKDAKTLRAGKIVEKAGIHMLKHEFKEAREVACKLEPGAPYYRDAVEIALRCSVILEDEEATARYIDLLVEHFPDYMPGIKLKLINSCFNACLETGKFRSLYKHYEEIYIQNKNLRGLKTLADVAKYVKKSDYVLSTLSAIEKIDPCDIQSAYELSFAEVAEGDFSHLKSRGERLKALFPEDSRASFISYYPILCQNKTELRGIEFVKRSAYRYLYENDPDPIAYEMRTEFDCSGYDLETRFDISWGALALGEIVLSSWCLEDIIDIFIEYNYNYCVRVLGNPDLDTDIKVYALELLLTKLSKEPNVVAILVDNHVKAITPVEYKSKVQIDKPSARTAARHIYSYIYAELVFDNINVDAEALAYIVDTLFVYMQNRTRWKNATCYALVYAEYLRMNKIETPCVEDVAERFDVNIGTVESRLIDVFGKY